MHSPVSIRDRFGTELTDHGIDCFTIYTDDRWQPDLLIPYEVDTHLYYPEPMFAGPRPVFHDQISRLLCSSAVDTGPPQPIHPEQVGTLNALFLQEASACPVIRTTGVQATYSQFRPLFDDFSAREHIASLAIFSARPPIDDPRCAPLLFFNSRRRQDFTNPLRRWVLAELATRVLAHVAEQEQQRSSLWATPLLDSHRAQSAILQLIDSHLLTTPTGAYSTVYDRLAEVLHKQLHRNHERLIVSIHTKIMRTTGTEVLERRGICGNRGETQRDAQSLFDPSDPSITTCTAVTGRSHLLQCVPPEGYVAVRLSRQEYDQLSKATRSRPAHLHLTESNLRESGGWLMAPRTLPEESIRSETTWLADHDCPHASQVLSVRRAADYSSLFRDLDSRWVRPCSEACVPIIIAQRTLGCVNLESERIDHFTPAVLNTLTTLATLAGTLVLRETDRAVRAASVGLAHRVHRSFAGSDSADLDQFARHMALALWCTRLNILARRDAHSTGFALVATSDREWYIRNGVGHPRQHGYTERLTSATDGLRGIVLDFPDHPGDGETQVFGVRVRKADTDPTTHILVEELCNAPPPRDPSNPPPQDRIARLIGLRVQSPVESDDPDGLGAGVVWCGYARREFVCDARTPYEFQQRDAVLGYLLGVAQQCSLAVTIGHSELARSLERNCDIRHSKALYVLERALSDIELAAKALRSAAPLGPIASHVDSARLVLSYLKLQTTIAEYLMRSPADLRHLADSLAIGTNIHEVVQESWHAATAMWDVGAAPLDHEFDDGTDCVHVHPGMLRVFLLQTFLNAVLHGSVSRAQGGEQVQLCARVEGNEQVVLRISNPGGAIHTHLDDPGIDAKGGWIANLNAHGRGLAIMRRLGEAIGVPPTSQHPPYEVTNRVGGGVCVTLRIPRAMTGR